MIHICCKILVSVAVLAGGFSSMAMGQEIWPTRGLMPNAEQLSSEIDNIDVASGKLHLNLPIASLPAGRGGPGVSVALKYDSRIYNIYPELWPDPPPDGRILHFLESAADGAGWSYNLENFSFNEEAKIDEYCNYPGEFHMLRRQWLTLPDGSRHLMHLNTHNANWPSQFNYSGDGYFGIPADGYIDSCSLQKGWSIDPGTTKLTYYSVDGSYLKLETEVDSTPGVSIWRLYYPDGKVVKRNELTGVTEFYDLNGNKTTLSYGYYDPGTWQHPYASILDDAGREIRINKNIESYDVWSRDSITVPGPNGTITWYVDWQAIFVGDDNREYYVYWDYVNYPEFHVPLGQSLWVVRYIHIPLNNEAPVALGTAPPGWKSYEFGYSDNSDLGYGELDFLRTPSGAQYAYRYRFEGTGQTPNYIYADNIALNNYITQKSITHDGVTDLQWNLQYNMYASPRNTVVTNPDSGQMQYDFLYSYGGLDLVEKIHGPLGSITKREWALNKAWGTRNFFLLTAPNNPYVAKEITTIGASGSPSKSSVAEYTYDKNGNLRHKKEYDWVNYPAESGGTLMRQTDLDYYVPAQYASYNDADDSNAYWQPDVPRRLDAVKRKSVHNGSFNTVAATDYYYSEDCAGSVCTKLQLIDERRWDSAKNPGQPAPAFDQLNSTNAQILTRGYDSYGNLTAISEPDVPTVNTYDDSHIVLQKVERGTSAEKRTTEYGWNSSKTFISSETDVENNLTNYFGYDNIGRKTSINEANQRWTSYVYYDSDRKTKVLSDLKSSQDGKLQAITHYDQLGRVRLTRKSDGTALNDQIETDGIKAKTIYSVIPGTGKRVVASTPYRELTDSTLEWSCTQYDLLGRVTAVAMFKGSDAPTNCLSATNRTGITTTAYNADWTTVVDPAGKIRKQRLDGAGRFVEVVEDPYPENPSGLNYGTTYQYDLLDNLTQVVQGSQTRTFVYSSLGRLLSATNPESGQTAYTYKESGDLWTKADARGKIVTMTYDSLHRIYDKTFNDGTPPVSYRYYVNGSNPQPPNIGRLGSVSSPFTTAIYGYNALGNITLSLHYIDGYTGDLVFSYDWYLNGAQKSIQYPTGRLVSYDVDDAGRTLKAYAPGQIYADMTSVTNPYTPDGRLRQALLGNGRWETREYSTPGTTTYYKLGTAPGDGSLLQLGYNFNPTTNNGNLDSQMITRGSSSWTQNYTYDNLNRILGMSESGVSPINRSYGYDQHGNRYVSGSLIDSREPTSLNDFNASNNRLAMSGVGYDDAGNQTAYSGFVLGYDAENRAISMTSSGSGSGTYHYDGDGRRVKKVWTVGSVTTTTYFVYDAMGRMAVEYSTETPSTTGTSYMFTDVLGSVRAITNSAGTVTECYDYLPFGRMLGSSVNGRGSCYPENPDNGFSSSVPQKFTGKERDAETGLDFFEARYYSGAQGRFLSVDPENAGAKKNDPQSWNAYAYARNNPLIYIDPDGCLYEVTFNYRGNNEYHLFYDHEFDFYKNRYREYYIFGGNGIIYSKQYGYEVGTYKYLIDDKLLAIIEGSERAGPTVNALGIGMEAFIAGAGVAAISSTGAGVAALEKLIALGPEVLAKLVAAGKLSQMAYSRLSDFIALNYIRFQGYIVDNWLRYDPEGMWKMGGKWIDGPPSKNPHWHIDPTGTGRLMDLHLPQEIKEWWHHFLAILNGR